MQKGVGEIGIESIHHGGDGGVDRDLGRPGEPGRSENFRRRSRWIRIINLLRANATLVEDDDELDELLARIDKAERQRARILARRGGAEDELPEDELPEDELPEELDDAQEDSSADGAAVGDAPEDSSEETGDDVLDTAAAS